MNRCWCEKEVTVDDAVYDYLWTSPGPVRLRPHRVQHRTVQSCNLFGPVDTTGYNTRSISEVETLSSCRCVAHIDWSGLCIKSAAI